jgi:hypothetical protein
MILTTRRVALSLFSLALACAPAAAQEVTGLASADVEALRVVNASELSVFLAENLGEDVQAAITSTGAVSFDYVAFDYVGGPQPIEVEGLVLNVGDLRIERYEMFDVDPDDARPGDQGMKALEQALWLANHDRQNPDEHRVVEVRKGRILIVSGDGAKDAATVNAIRPLAWQPRGSDWPVNLLSIQAGDDTMAFHVDRAASTHDLSERALGTFTPGRLDLFRDAGATVSESSNRVRVEFDDLVAEQRTEADGSTTLTMADSIAGERAVSESMATLIAANGSASPATSPSPSATGGALGSIGNALGR